MRKQFPEGQMGFWLAQNAPLKPGVFLHVVDREEDALDLLQVMNFCAPQVRTIHLPAWDCLPYDRLSPSKEILIKRVQALEALKWSCQKGISVLVLLTPQALMQKVSSSFGKGGKEETSLTLSRGSKVFRDDLLGQLHKWGFERQEVVREWGEFALRGSLVDIFPGGEIAPLRLDFFGDLLEQIKT
ncbi:MAG: transcription-repair coupling factor, partial [Holosporales bacterium]